MTDYIKILNSTYFSVGSFAFFQIFGKMVNLDGYATQLRILYIVVQLAIFLSSYGLILKIKQKNDETVLKYVEPAGQSWDGTETQERLVSITVRDYDVDEVKKGIRQSFMGIGMIALIHLKFGFIQPLLVQSILGFKTFLTTKEARLHIWNHPATGDLRRPFRVEAPFGLVSEKKQPKTDKGSIKKAEKALKAE